MEPIGKPVRFIANPLQKPQRVGILRQSQRERASGPVDLLEFLGQPDDRQFVQTEALQLFAGGGELAFAAVDDDQVRQPHGIQPCAGGARQPFDRLGGGLLRELG